MKRFMLSVALVMTAGVISAGPAAANPYLPVTNILDGSFNTAPAATTRLATTGADIAAMVLGGLLLIALGTLLVIVTRRRSRREES
jgi:LPXTG-motif cell wall-anchored protein